MNRKKIYIKELDCYGYEYNLILKCNNWVDFFYKSDVKYLKRLLLISNEQNNYEMSQLLNKCINEK